MSYLPIEQYGVIGDMRSVALVGRNGSIDWCCLPAFDSPSLFAAILDDRKGGHWLIAPDGQPAVGKQMYLPNTNVLVTRFFTDQGMGEVTDFMPIGPEAGGETEQVARQIVRIARAVRGPVRFRMECFPAFDYARAAHTTSMVAGGRTVVFSTTQGEFVLKSPHPLKREETGASTTFNLNTGEEAVFVLRLCGGCSAPQIAEQEAHGESLLNETVRFWRGWVAQNRYHGRWRETVIRSALALKLLTYLPTGAIVAAPTTSLPEEIGGVRNWDYRYTWVRDAAFTVYALIRLGYTAEAEAFSGFIQERAKEKRSEPGPLSVLYGIDGRHDLAEQTLDHLEGYCGSRPVRVGNAAAEHLQLDIYGELMDSVYLYDKYGAPISYEMWRTVERLLDWVSDNWQQPDQSIWEVRGGRRQFTYSKLQCWVALDRGVRLAFKHSYPTENFRWLEERNRIYRTIMQDCWNQRDQSFVQFCGTDAVDASALMFPLMLFISPKDPRMLSTLKRIRQELVSDALVRRYEIGKAARDGLPGHEGFFTVCSFWLVEAMTRAGQVEEARFLFEKLLSYGNHLGLFSEEISSKGELVGNFPQALTHLGLISAALRLDLTLG